MRNPERIQPVLNEVSEYWTNHPDLRLGQILSNAARTAGVSAPYYLEDDVLLELLQACNAVIGCAKIGTEEHYRYLVSIRGKETWLNTEEEAAAFIQGKNRFLVEDRIRKHLEGLTVQHEKQK
ncbi:MAG: DUF1040 family protein [Solobacterium sp.]|nr:DUF1040 family protein [Solobacterium sp.]